MQNKEKIKHEGTRFKKSNKNYPNVDSSSTFFLLHRPLSYLQILSVKMGEWKIRFKVIIRMKKETAIIK